jgi:MYXO-CTERM domain-containing protein
MKVKTLVLAAGAGALMAVGTASASFTGWSYDVETVSHDGSSYDVYRFYIDFAPNTQARVLGAGSIDLSVSGFGTSDPNGFLSVQNAGFGYAGAAANYAPMQFQVDLIPGAAYTSFMTIGHRAGGGQGTLGLTPGAFGIDASTQNVWTHAASDGSLSDPHIIGPNELIFTSNPDAGHITPQHSFATYGEWRVMLLQLTVGAGEDLEVNWAFAVQDMEGGPGVTKNGKIDFSTGVPAPGAMALLGLAGLVGTRRRRA